MTSYFYKNIYHKIIYLYFCESIFQDKSIHMVFVFRNSTTWKLFMVYISNVWFKPCLKQHSFQVWREYCIPEFYSNSTDTWRVPTHRHLFFFIKWKGVRLFCRKKKEEDGSRDYRWFRWYVYMLRLMPNRIVHCLALHCVLSVFLFSKEKHAIHFCHACFFSYLKQYCTSQK